MNGRAPGPAADYCPSQPGEPHVMECRSTGGKKVRYVEMCMLCKWIDGAALDGYADNAIKENLSARAARHAVAAETEPFAFAQSPGEELPLAEIVGQALGAASVCWESPEGAGVFDSSRARTIYKALMAEIERSMMHARELGVLAYKDEQESRAAAG